MGDPRVVLLVPMAQRTFIWAAGSSRWPINFNVAQKKKKYFHDLLRNSAGPAGGPFTAAMFCESLPPPLSHSLSLHCWTTYTGKLQSCSCPILSWTDRQHSQSVMDFLIPGQPKGRSFHHACANSRTEYVRTHETLAIDRARRQAQV